MKKTILITIILTIALVMAMIVSVNAAEFSVDDSEVKVGDKVTVKVEATNPQYGFEFIVNYPTEYFTFVGANAGSLELLDPNLDTDGEVGIVAYSGKNTEKFVTLTFEAKKETAENNVQFSIKNFVAGSEEMRNSLATVKVAAQGISSEEPAPGTSTTPQTPPSGQGVTSLEKDVTSTEKDATSAEKDVTPKTGSVDVAMYVISSIVVLGVITLAIKKIKNK